TAGVRGGSRAWRVLSASLLAAVTALLAATYTWSAAPWARTSAPRVAVMPLAGGAAPEDAQLAAALTTELAEALAGNPGLRVLARGSTQRYSGADHGVALKDLGADAVLV